MYLVLAILGRYVSGLCITAIRQDCLHQSITYTYKNEGVKYDGYFFIEGTGAIFTRSRAAWTRRIRSKQENMRIDLTLEGYKIID